MQWKKRVRHDIFKWKSIIGCSACEHEEFAVRKKNTEALNYDKRCPLLFQTQFKRIHCKISHLSVEIEALC